MHHMASYSNFSSTIWSGECGPVGAKDVMMRISVIKSGSKEF